VSSDLIQRSIAELGHDSWLTEGGSKIVVKFGAGGQKVTLSHTFPDELLCLPKFDLVSGHGLGKLAHVLTDGNSDGGRVCIGDDSSTAVNTDRPELAYQDAVREHVLLLTRLIEDPAYNREEQLREFEDHWQILCGKKTEELKELFVVWDGDRAESLQVRHPHRHPNSGMDLQKRPIALVGRSANDPRLLSVRLGADWGTRPVKGKAVAVRLIDLEPAPATQGDLLPWYFGAVRRADSTSRSELRRLHKKKSGEYWLVFSAPIPDGETLFAIHWYTRSRGALPASETEVEAGRWTATPYRVRSLSRGSLVPRGGGSLALTSKSVLLVGCGSVGSELAMQLISAGVGHLTISDPETLSEENLYRHALSVKDIGQLKTVALAGELALKHPWIEVKPLNNQLEQLRDPAVLQTFDLLVIAIGSSTVERVFAEYCRQERISVPVMNCWLEGYGIGGHAILTVPETKGCWHCAYVDPKTLTRGLVSNLNFLAPDQVVMRNHGGCGTQFLPYSGIAVGYSASIAADLAVRFLEGQVTNSSKVSWKGSDEEAKRASLAVTRRYRHFADSLRILPLHDDNCDLCGG